MTKEEAVKLQERLSKDYNLGFWFGVNCNKCCDVYPKLITNNYTFDSCYYQCPVCGTRTKDCSMPWISQELWNKKIFLSNQLKLF